MAWRTTLGILLLTTSVTAQAGDQFFAADWSSAKWVASGDKLSCRLHQIIPNYGVAEFLHPHASDLTFHLRRHFIEPASGIASIESVAPNWKGVGKASLLGKVYLRDDEVIFMTEMGLARNMVTELRSGQMNRIHYVGKNRDAIRIDLIPIDFQNAYAQFVRCEGKLLAFSRSDVEEAAVYFESGTQDLSAVAIKQLDNIAEYVLADTTIRRIHVAGYSDGGGRSGYNNWLSELRARAVRDYLKLKGVPQEKIKITWYGEKKADTENNNSVGRALNRRVKIKLFVF